MKITLLFYSIFLPVITMMLSGQTAMKVDMKDVTDHIDMDGQFFMANNVEGDLEKLAALGTDFLKNARKHGKKRFPTGLDLKLILGDMGLNDLVSYGRSAKFAGDHWVSKLYLQNQGSNRGVFSMMGEKNTEYEVLKFAPSGADFVMEWQIDTRQLGAVMKHVPGCVRMEKAMKRNLTGGETVEDVLNMYKGKVSLAVKLDDKVREACPIYPEYTFPKLHGCLRLKGVTPIWKHLGAVAGFMMKMVRQEDGTLLMIPRKQPKKMNAAFVLDMKNDVLWAGTSIEFLNECRGRKAGLSVDKGYKALSGGSRDGCGVVYISKQACMELRQVKEAKYKKRGKSCLSEEMRKRVLDHLTESENGYYAEVRKSEKGINVLLKAPCPVKEILCFKRCGKRYGKKCCSAGKGKCCSRSKCGELKKQCGSCERKKQRGCPLGGGSKKQNALCNDGCVSGCKSGKCSKGKRKSNGGCASKCGKSVPKSDAKALKDAKRLDHTDGGDQGDM